MSSIAAHQPSFLDLGQSALTEAARRLMAAFGSPPEQANATPTDMANPVMEELLAFAAMAQQQIADQQARITYLEGLATTDELTGLTNRRGLDEFLRQTLSRARRHREEGVVASFDLDGFKEINDCYGHAAGDAALRHVARVLNGCVRETDCVARPGGDEFVVVLVRTALEDGRRQIARLQAALSEQPTIIAGRRFTLKASAGVASYGPRSTVTEVLAAADTVMYSAKRSRAYASLMR
ncbi:GGDEF domain-containing protein [Zavarzinia sp. CC-PAN008]|uniref:GGDEF domain-containing protein n=1 Tax=Zavarzinia sp. CC-PAN008 TaxID=3243332 RepID=UPI003F7445B7